MAEVKEMTVDNHVLTLALGWNENGMVKRDE